MALIHYWTLLSPYSRRIIIRRSCSLWAPSFPLPGAGLLILSAVKQKAPARYHDPGGQRWAYWRCQGTSVSGWLPVGWCNNCTTKGQAVSRNVAKGHRSEIGVTRSLPQVVGVAMTRQLLAVVAGAPTHQETIENIVHP